MAEKPTYEALEQRIQSLETRNLALRETEEALRRGYKRLLAAVESLPFDFFSLDADGRYEMQNSACVKHWGNVIGKRPQDLRVNGATLALWQENNRRAMSGETVREDVAFPVAGQERHFHNIISPIFDDGEVEGIVGINIDITERKRTEEGLQATLAREQEEAARVEAIIASIGDGLTIIDNNFRILYENKLHQDIFGKHVGEYCYTAYRNKDQVCEGCPAVESLKDGKIHTRERTVEGDKGTQYFEVTASPYVGWTGEIAGAIEVVRDITERKRAEQALKRSERILSSTLEALDGLLVVIDRDRRVLLSNWKGHDFVTEQDRQAPVYCYKAFKHLDAPCDYCPPVQAFADGQHRVYEDRNPVDGSFKEIHVTPIFDDAGKVAMVVEYVQDVTERRQAQEAFRLASERLEYLLSSCSAVIYAAEASGDYGATFISENVVRLTGYEKEEFLENANFWIDHVHPQDRPIVLEEVRKIFEKELHAHEYRFQCKDGNYIWVGDEMRLVRDRDGQPLEIIGFWVDITRRKQTERALMEKEKVLEDQAQNLERVNTALNVLLEHRENEKKELEENITANAKKIIFPYIEKMEKSRLTLENKGHLDAIRSNLEALISPFASKVSSKYLDFTPTEIEIADHIRRGKTSKEISDLLHVSLKAVAFHRHNIRKKLGILNKKINLRSYLQSISR